MEVKRSIIIFSSFIVLAFLALIPTFLISLAGDDWLAIYRFIQTFRHVGDYFYFPNFAGNYDAANIIIGSIYALVGNKPVVYYIVSFIFRVGMGLALYKLLNVVSGNRVANSWIAGGALVLFAGAESVSWVFNMNTFVAITLFFGFIYAHLKYKGIKQMICGASLLFGAFLIAPTRMHGLVFVIPLLILFFHTSKKQLVLLPLLYFLPIVLFRLAFQAGNDSSYTLDILYRLGSGSFWKVFTASLTSAVFPDRLIGWHYLKVIGLGILAVVILVQRKNKVAIFFLILAAAFLIIPQLLNPQAVFTSEHRYLLLPAMLIWMSAGLSVIKRFKKVNSFFILASGCYLVVQLISTYSYFRFLYENGRNAREVDGYFSQLQPVLSSLETNKPGLILITGNNPTRMYNAITFGFTPKVLVLYPNFTPKTAPFIVDDRKSLELLLHGDAQELYRYGYSDYTFDEKDIYSFELLGTRLVETTDQTRSAWVKK